MKPLTTLAAIAVTATCLAFAGRALALGINTHNAVAKGCALYTQLAAFEPDLKALLEAYPGAVECGSAWPDVHYAIQTFPGAHDLAEFTHWAPHYTDAFTYIQNTFRQPYNEEARRLIAFYLGVITHSITDEWWHGLGRATCDSALEASERNDGALEGNTEFFIDLYIQMNLMAGPNPEQPWYVPINHTINILRREGYTEITHEDQMFGVALDYIGAWVEDLIGPLFYFPLQQTMPWTVANFFTWPCGGFEDCTKRSAWEMNAVWKKLKERGYPVTAPAPEAPAVCIKAPLALSKDFERRLTPRNPLLQAPSHHGVELRHALALFQQGIIGVDITEAPGGYEIGHPHILNGASFQQYVATKILPGI